MYHCETPNGKRSSSFPSHPLALSPNTAIQLTSVRPDRKSTSKVVPYDCTNYHMLSRTHFHSCLCLTKIPAIALERLAIENRLSHAVQLSLPLSASAFSRRYTAHICGLTQSKLRGGRNTGSATSTTMCTPPDQLTERMW